jgi:tight adherence protein C
MQLGLAVLLFLLLAGVTMAVSVKLWVRPKAAMERITGTVVRPESALPVHPSLVFRDLAARIGAVLPAAKSKSGKSGLTERRLEQAGYRSPHALQMLQGSRLLLAAVFAATALAVASAWSAASDNRIMAVAGAGLVGFIAPGTFLGFMVKRRRHRIRRSLPDALDLLVICVESGLGLDQALMQTAKELEIAHKDISLEFTLFNLEIKTGKRRPEALRSMAERTGVADLKKLVAILIQADRFGTSIAQSLRTHADYMRVQARQKAEELAAKVGVKLVFPIFFCILPTLFVVTVGPMAVRIVREMLPMMKNL